MAAGNFAALANVEVKEFDLDGMHFKVQFNPARIVSSGAKVDAAAIKARKCFLCDENRPAEQRGIEWNGHYTVLLNPFPIFPRHLTIPDTSHTLQLINGRIADMIKLAGELDEYTVFYNGPRCGASAPDHMHFQAGSNGLMTIKDATMRTLHSIVAEEKSGAVRLSLSERLPFPFFVIDATPEDGAEMFGRLYRSLPEDGEEPMMNILCYRTVGGVRTIVVPRKRHRPSFYGTEGDGCMMISPASVDVGGVIITPRAQDFKKIDAETVKRMFDEVCMDKNDIKDIVNKIKSTKP